jgi:hypothetical protein
VARCQVNDSGRGAGRTREGADRDKAERARNKFLETQMVIEALERAMNAEERALR